MRFHGPSTERARLKGLTRTNLVVTTYDAYHAEASWFQAQSWGVTVLDEGCVAAALSSD